MFIAYPNFQTKKFKLQCIHLKYYIFNHEYNAKHKNNVY